MADDYSKARAASTDAGAQYAALIAKLDKQLPARKKHQPLMHSVAQPEAYAPAPMIGGQALPPPPPPSMQPEPQAFRGDMLPPPPPPALGVPGATPQPIAQATIPDEELAQRMQIIAGARGLNRAY